MKPNLIKFSCPACGTRLAVPLSMAGHEDHCPKCSTMVSAPIPKDQTNAPSSVQSASPSSETTVASNESTSGLRPALLDEFLSGPASAEAVPDTITKPQKKSRNRQARQEVAPEPPIPPEPAIVAPALAESPLASDPGPIDDAPPFDQPLEDSWNEPPGKNLPDIGMGDALASYLTSPKPSISRQVTPSLGVGLHNVLDMPRHDRRTRRAPVMIVGLLLFLVVDAGAAMWFFRHRIQEWWAHGNPSNIKPVTPSPSNDQTSTVPDKIDPKVEQTDEVKPNPAESPNSSTKPESRTDTEKPPVPTVVPVQPESPPPAVTPTEPSPVKPPDVITIPPPVVAKLDIDPPPPPPPAPIIADISPPSNIPTDAPQPPVGNEEVTAARTALESLKAFLAAPGISERLRWCQKPDVVRPLMERHYTSHPDGPVKVGRIDLVASYPSKDGVPPYSMFEMTGGSLKKSVLALVEEKPKNEHRVDWEAFVEFKDGLLWEFMSKPGSRAQKFRVIMRRTHYFDKDVPDVGNKDGFEISQPGSEAVAHVFIERSSPISRQLAQRLGWDGKIPVTMELIWRADGTHHWVEIQTMTSFGWRG